MDSMPGPEPGPFCRARLSISKLEGPLFGVEIKTKSEGQENCLLMISRCGTAVLWPEVNISETFYCSHVRCKTGRDAADISVAVECLQAACSIIIAAGVLQADTKLVCVFCRLTAVTLIIAEHSSEDLHLRYGLIKMPIYIQYIP